MTCWKLCVLSFLLVPALCSPSQQRFLCGLLCGRDQHGLELKVMRKEMNFKKLLSKAVKSSTGGVG